MRESPSTLEGPAALLPPNINTDVIALTVCRVGRGADIVNKQARLRACTPWVRPSREDVATAGR